MPLRSKIGGHIVLVLSVILSFCHPLWNFNLANNFWTASARALIFHMSIWCEVFFFPPKPVMLSCILFLQLTELAFINISEQLICDSDVEKYQKYIVAVKGIELY